MNIITPVPLNAAERTRMKVNNRLSKGQPPCNFKGAPATLITEADRQILNVFSHHYGNVGERLGQKVGKLVTQSNILKKSSRFAMEKGALSIREKGVGQAIAENIIFPFVNLPLYAASWALKKLQSVPALKNGAKAIYNKPLLRIPRKLNELDQKTDMLKGIFDKTQSVVAKFAKEKGISKEYLLAQLNKCDDTPQAQQLVKEANEYIKESLYKVSNKFFDKHTGNFNTAFERPLNRIVTGLIPVLFLANDAYNLSVMCGDDKEVSKKEANERKKQEISRVFTTAYIQLLTFGAFTKQVNTIPWFTPLTSAATVLFSEVTSRKRLGKPVFFLSKEKAKDYNQNKEVEKEEQKKSFFDIIRKKSDKTDKSKTEEAKTSLANQKPAQVINSTTARTQSYFNDSETPQIFANFKGSVKDNELENKHEKSEKTEKQKNEKKEQKALINFKTFKKGVIILVSAGFALSFLKNSSFTKNSAIVKGIKNFGDFCKKKIYNPLAFKDFEITQSEFDTVAKSLKDAGCKEIAEGHEFIKQKYGRQTADGIIRMYKASLPKSAHKRIYDTVISKLNETGASLSDSEIKQIVESVKTAIGLEGTSIAEMKYGNVAKKASEIITNKKVNLNLEQMNVLKNAVTEAIKQSAKETPVQIETKLKPFVDIFTQPFKFIMSALRLPFKLTSTLINIAVSPIEKKAAEAALGKAELTNFQKGIHRVVTEVLGEKSSKAGKTSQTIFVNAIEKLQRQTMPYRKAEKELEKALVTGSESAIEKARAAVDKAKHDLLVYVNTAVEKSFNGVTQSSNKNTDLAMMSKLASSAVTSAFLVADNYNMVMLKSNGEDTEGAKEKANERIIQRLSALFYQTLLINWFNATFRSTYNSSLKGMAAVAIPNTITTEVLTRKSIGMPIGRKSYEELQAIDEKNEKRTGFAGKYFKFMRLLTGKKPLKDRIPKDKMQKNSEDNFSKVNNSDVKQSTNLLELYSKK